MNKATCSSQSMSHFLNNVYNNENPILVELPGWSQGSPEDSKVSYTL